MRATFGKQDTTCKIPQSKIKHTDTGADSAPTAVAGRVDSPPWREAKVTRPRACVHRPETLGYPTLPRSSLHGFASSELRTYGRDIANSRSSSCRDIAGSPGQQVRKTSAPIDPIHQHWSLLRPLLPSSSGHGCLINRYRTPTLPLWHVTYTTLLRLSGIAPRDKNPNKDGAIARCIGPIQTNHILS